MELRGEVKMAKIEEAPWTIIYYSSLIIVLAVLLGLG
jgi:hypothetical protein